MLDRTLEIESHDDQTITVDGPTLYHFARENPSVLAIGHDVLSDGDHFSNPCFPIIIRGTLPLLMAEYSANGMPNPKKNRKTLFSPAFSMVSVLSMPKRL